MHFQALLMVAAGAAKGSAAAPDVTPPTITSGSTGTVAENSTLAFSLTANETVTWSITGGADAAQFEISGSTLRWASNGTKDFEAPTDANSDNAYIVQVTATDPSTNATNKTVTITVTDVSDTAASVGPLSAASGTDLGGGTGWSDTGNVNASDDAYATATLSTGQTSGFLRTNDFGFAIPGSASITGLQVDVEGSADVATVTLQSFALAFNNSGDASDQFGFNSGTIDLINVDSSGTVGGPGDTWGAFLTPTAVNDPAFSIDFVATKSKSGTATVFIDNVRVTIFYT
jgi:hypothetical protein